MATAQSRRRLQPAGRRARRRRPHAGARLHARIREPRPLAVAPPRPALAVRRGTRRRTGPHARRTLLNRVGARREIPASVCRFRRERGCRRRYTAVRYRIENN
ncbi:hypothetical protein C452_13274 [Haloferax volcanii JCM 10717]|uniref:Uncharacterized protein n=1 Tax=Haloferax volcanii JCM 10717 TaxID=1227458 RepID=M0HVB8_HALVO|nr:hypothetical protein C452_13274 [Haloferax alexandrinus JCM 10717]